jgi:hypothetical protein
MIGNRRIPAGLAALSGLALAGLAVLGSAPAAGALEIGLSSSRDRVAVGEPFTVTVEVRHGGVGRVPEPELAVPDGIRQVSRSTSQNFSYINGRATSSYSVNYVMVGEREGTYEIGPARAEKGDEVAVSTNVAVEVKPAGSSAAVPQLGDDVDPDTDRRDLIVIGQVDDDNPWVNQQMTYTFTFLRAVRILEGSRYTPPPTTGFWTEELDTTEPREVVVDGRRYIAERLRTALFPTGPGEYTIGEAYLNTTVEDRNTRGRRRDPFDIFGSDRFGVFRSGREVVLKTDPVRITVRPLPAEGKPEDFSGAVGKFQISAQADRTELKAGEPITLTVRLSGDGNVKVVPSPDMSGLEGFKIYESSSEEESKAVDGRIRGTKTWEWVIVPTTGGEVEIPPVTLSTFDPETGRYVRLATAAIPIDVDANALDAAMAAGGDLALAKERVRLRQRDIRWVKEAPPRALGGGASSPWSSPGFLLAHVIPVLAFAGSVTWRRHRERLRRDVRYARRRGAGRVAAKRLASSREALSAGRLEAFWGELSGALRGYVADRFHLAAANLDEAEVRKGLAALELPDERVEELFALLERCDGARFSPIGTDEAAAADSVEQARAWIDDLERR